MKVHFGYIHKIFPSVLVLVVQNNNTAGALEDRGWSVVVEKATGRWEQQAAIRGGVNCVKLVTF